MRNELEFRPSPGWFVSREVSKTDCGIEAWRASEGMLQQILRLRVRLQWDRESSGLSLIRHLSSLRCPSCDPFNRQNRKNPTSSPPEHSILTVRSFES